MRHLLLGWAIGLAIVILLPEPVEAQVRAQIYLTQQRIPRGLSERALVRWARGHRATRINETTEEELDDREWRPEMIVQFNRPPNDLEFQVVYYDVEDGERRYIATMPVYVSDRTQRTYVQRIRLQRPEFTPNRRMELIVTVRRVEAGRLAFEVLGEERRHTGQVDFSDADTRGEQTAPEEDSPPPEEEEHQEPVDQDPQVNAPPPVRPSEANRSSGGCATTEAPPAVGLVCWWFAFLALRRRKDGF